MAPQGERRVLALELSSRLVLRFLGAHRTPEQTVTEEEVKAIVAEGVTARALKLEEKEMISGVMRLEPIPKGHTVPK